MRFFKIISLALLVWMSNFNIAMAEGDTTTPVRPNRVRFMICFDAALYAGAMTTSYTLWYKDFSHSSFHWVNDNAENQQVDKFGHMFCSYQEGVYGYNSFKWAGMSENKAAIYGGGLGIILQTTVETLDGFSSGWGASPGDLMANTAGSCLFISQQLAWHDQRIKMKWSYWTSQYSRVKPDFSGPGAIDIIMGDYNAHTYWLSVSPSTFMKKESAWPAWLNVAVGYSGDGMYSGFNDADYDFNGRRKSYYPLQRQFFISPDIDFTRIPVKNKFLKQVLKVVNILKFPAPAVEYATSSHWKFHYLYF